MKQITVITQLKQGDEILHIRGHKFEVLKFICQNIFVENHFIFYKENGDLTTLNHSELKNQEWFLVEDTPQFWLEAWEKRKRILLDNIQTVEEVISNLKGYIDSHEK